ncbi:MAG: TRAP transporter small permease subunit [Actinomycetota bacterium]
MPDRSDGDAAELFDEDIEEHVDEILDELGPEPRLHDRIDDVAEQHHGGVGIYAPAEEGTALSFYGVHPLGWVAAIVLVAALLASTVFDTEYQIGNFGWGLWTFVGAVLLLSLRPIVLHWIRLGIEGIATVTKTIAWILAWAVFGFQLFNVVTRYGNDLVEQDILLGEVVSLAAQSFALMFLLGINYGMRDGVNPRIDFWWANFSNRTKAWLDFVLHAALLAPFTWMAIRILQPYAATSLGRRFNGEWPEGAAVWRTWEQATDAGQLPVGPIKAMILVAFCLLALQLLAELIKTGFIMMGKDEYGDIADSDVPQRIE